MEGSLDKRFCQPLWTIYNKLEVGGKPDSSFVLGLHWTADGIDIFWIDFALPYIMKFVALVSRRIVHTVARISADIYSTVSIYIYELYAL
jgi:hypothetical protein